MPTITDLTNHIMIPGPGIINWQHQQNVYRLPRFVQAPQEPVCRLQRIRPHVQLHQMLKIHHQALLWRHCLKLLSPLCCLYSFHLCCFQIIGNQLMIKFTICITKLRLDGAFFQSNMSSHIRAIHFDLLNKIILSTIRQIKGFSNILNHGGQQWLWPLLTIGLIKTFQQAQFSSRCTQCYSEHKFTQPHSVTLLLHLPRPVTWTIMNIVLEII